MALGPNKLTQFALGALIFISCSSALSAPKIIGEVKPPPDFNWGDWGSSGTLPELDVQVAQYEPDYSVIYDCQMHITDQVTRVDVSGRSFWSVGMAEFNFNDTVRTITSDSLTWYHKRVYREEQVALDAQKSLPFSVKGQSASLQILQGPQLDEVRLQVNLKQNLGDISVSESASRLFLRSDEEIIIEKDLLLTSSKGSILPSTLVRVLCQRKL